MQLTVSPWHPALPLIEDRVTVAEDPGQSYGSAAAAGFYFLGMSDQWRDRVTPYTALTYSAFWACVRIISQTLAGIGWHVFERQERGARKLPINDNIAWTLDMQANPEMSAFEWRQCMLKDALVWGNAYAEIERTNGGKVLWLWRLDPERVCPERDDAGRLYYRIENHGARDSFLDPGNVFHIRGLGPDGVVGYSVVEMARRSIELGLQEERFGSEFFRRGPMPGGLLKMPTTPNEEAQQKLRQSFERVYGGAQNAGRVVLLTGGMDFTAMSLPNNDAQFLESRTFQVSEICRWFGVPPHKLADLSRATFSNIEEQERAFVADCLLPWARRLESEADIKLYGSVSMGRRYTRMNLDALQRGNSATQTETVVKKVTGGLMTPNEGREFFDLNPDKAGDVLMVQGQMLPLERAIEAPPEPPPQLGPGAATDGLAAALTKLAALRAGWSEEDHPREDDGKFGEGGGGAQPMHDDEDAADKWAKDHVKGEAHTAAEDKALKDYSKEGYKEINGHLRGTAPAKDAAKIEEQTKRLDAAIDKKSVDKTTIAARGYQEDPDKSAKLFPVGTVVHDKGYMSTTIQSNVAELFGEAPGGKGQSRQTQFRITVPKGTNAAYMGHRQESELLLGRGTKLRVTRHERETNKYVDRLIIHAEVIGRSPSAHARSSILGVVKKAVETEKFNWRSGDIQIQAGANVSPKGALKLAACGGEGSGVPGPCPSKTEEDKPEEPHDSAKEAKAWAEKNVEKSEPYSKDEEQSIQNYRRKGYENINVVLRGTKDVKGAAKEKADRDIKQLDSAIEKTTINKAVVVMRGLTVEPNAAEASCRVGRVIEDKGFMSTSIEKGVANNFGLTKGGQTLFRITVPAGTKGLFIGTRGESELLLKRGTKIKVTKLERVNHSTGRATLTVHAEVQP